MRWSNAVELRAAGLIVATLLFLPQLALAQFTQQGPKLVGAGAVGNAYQGVSVALSADGNTAIVGGYGDDANVGAAWVFTRSNGSWTQQGNKLIGSDAVNAASQGYSVAISADGNTVLIGGPGDNPGTINDAAGAAWVFTRSGGVWTQQGSKLVGSGAVLAGAGGSGGQGYSVALSADGNTAVVGAPTDNAAAGAAWVFTRNSGVWTQLGSKLVGTGAVGKAEQGSSVAISGDGNTIIVGGPYDNAGAAWVFTQTAGVWTQQGNKLAITGYSVALSVDGNTAIIGLPRIGAAIFARTNGVWTQQGGYLIGSGAIGGWNGAAVSLSGDGNTAIVGGPADNPGAMGGGVGAVWFFARSNSVWTQQGLKLVGSGAVGIAGQGFGVALSGDGNTAIEGGPNDGANIGAAWVYVQGSLQVSPAINIITSGNPGGPFAPASFQYQLSATAGSVDYAISGAPNWLTPSSTSGTLSTTGTTVTFTVNTNANSLAVGTYGPTTITFANSRTGQGTTTVSATLTVNPPALQVSPATSIAASGTHGGPFPPSSFRYELSATYGSVKYSITTPSWLTASSNSGTVTTSAKTITFEVNSSARSLQPNTYVSSVSFSNTANSQGNTTRVATLVVDPKQYKLTVDASPPADGTVSGGGTFAEGSSQTVTANAKSGHTFLHWTDAGKVVSAAASYTFTMPSANVTLVAHFQ